MTAPRPREVVSAGGCLQAGGAALCGCAALGWPADEVLNGSQMAEAAVRAITRVGAVTGRLVGARRPTPPSNPISVPISGWLQTLPK